MPFPDAISGIGFYYLNWNIMAYFLFATFFAGVSLLAYLGRCQQTNRMGIDYDRFTVGMGFSAGLALFMLLLGLYDMVL